VEQEVLEQTYPKPDRDYLELKQASMQSLLAVLYGMELQ
jgi:hypothetical protein